MRIKGTVGLHLDDLPGPRGDNSKETSQVAASGRGPRKGRILIMDDDRLVRDTMRLQLAIFGYEAVASPEGREAVALYEQARSSGRPFDAVILDLMVEGGWGGERTLLELRKVDPGVRALVCSGSMTGSVADYLRQGFCGALSKPYSLGDLCATVEAALPAG